MKILVINNHTQHLVQLKAALTPYELEIVKYQPGITFNWQDKDLVILSGGGGEGNEINDTADVGKLWYEDEMDFILECKKPIVGICMGFEVIARAFGSTVEEMDGLIQGYRKLSTTSKGRAKFSKKHINQYEAHQWRVNNISSKEFEVLATSDSGIEIIKHKTRPIIASQFHPEKGGTLKLRHFIKQAVA